MAGSVLKQGTTKELRKLLAQLAAAMAETLGSLIARELAVRPGELKALSLEELLGSLTRPNAVVRGALDKDYAGKTLFALFEVQDATAMAGMLMMTPDHVIEQRRNKNLLEGEDAEAFGELGNVLCSGLGNVLRDNVTNIDLRLLDHGLIKPGLDDANLLPDVQLVAIELNFQVGTFPATVAKLLIDRETAEKWNQRPLDTDAIATPAKAAPEQRTETQNRIEDDSLEDIPAAPVRGVLNAFLASTDPYRLLRRCCRRVGFELRRFGRSEIPNPAAHRNEVVLLDVPLADERRFEWCKRIKEFDANVKIVMLLHRPSRARVMRAFLSQADVILGWPCEEAQLGQKLQDLFGDAPPVGDS